MYSFSWEVPVTSLKWKIQVAARRPTPQTQSRGRRRVCLGLLGTFIPPAAAAARWLSGQNMSPPRSLLLTPVPRFQAGSQWPVALPPPPPPIYRLDAILSLGSIHDTGGCLIGSACHQHLSIQHQSVSAKTQHPHPQAQTPAGKQTQWIISLYHYKKIYFDPHRRHIPPALNIIPSLWSSVWEEAFSWSLRKDHQGAPSAGWGDWRDWQHGKPWIHIYWSMLFKNVPSSKQH